MQNIKAETVIFKKIFSYFSDWVSERENVMQAGGLSLSTVSKYYIAPQTHINLLTMVR